MKLFKFGKPARPKKRARRGPGLWALEAQMRSRFRALIPAAVLALVCTLAVAVRLAPTLPRIDPPPYQSLSLDRSPEQVAAAYKSIFNLVNERYIKRDRASDHLAAMADAYEDRLNNDGDLVNACNMLFDGLGDPWAELLSKEEYEDRRLREQGFRIGVPLSLQYDTEGNYWKAVALQKAATDAGLEEGDAILDIDGDDVTEIESGQFKQVEAMMTGNGQAPFGSMFTLQVYKKRTGEVTSYDLPRIILGQNSAITTRVLKDERHNEAIQGVVEIKIDHFAHPKLVEEVNKALDRVGDVPARGVVLIVTGVNGGDARQAALCSALFMDSGPICHRVCGVEGKIGSYWVDTWEVAPRTVRLVRRGPYTNGGGAPGEKPKPQGPDQVLEEVTQVTGVFRGPLAVAIDIETRGSVELFASALRKYGTQVAVFGSSPTWGKGLGQTYFVGTIDPDVFQFSTAYYLGADGGSIDAKAVMPTRQNGLPMGVDPGPQAVRWVFDRLRTVTEPVLPSR